MDTVRTLWWAGGISAAAGAAALTIGVLIWPRAHAKSGASAWWAPSIGPSTLGVIGAF